MGPDTEAVAGRSRKGSEPTLYPAPHSLPTGSGRPASLRLATDEELQQEEDEALEMRSDSVFGIQSLPDERSSASPSPHEKTDSGYEDEGSIQRPMSKRHPDLKISPIRSPDEATPGHSPPSEPSDHPVISKVPSISHSITSLSLDSQAALSSLPSSPKSVSHQSFRPSDDESADESTSQAVASSSEDEEPPTTEMQDSAPQLVMPSIKMPSRRPFTHRGKALGKLKLLIAGDSGVGKTSLIKSIVQTCEDIVHVDPLPPSGSFMGRSSIQRDRNASSELHRPTQHICEVYASSRPYPSWYSEAETRTILRRKSLDDHVLERNICFVDTPGYSSGMSRMENMNSIVHYMSDQARKSFSTAPGEGDIVGLFSGIGGLQVDLVLFLVSEDIKDDDVSLLQRLAKLSNIIILISKSDKQSPEEVELLRRSVMSKLRASGISQFRFPLDNANQAPFAVSSIPSEDEDTMDASLLMSSEYVQPLMPSELGLLMQQIFEQQTTSFLRHLAATKLVQAQRLSSSRKSLTPFSPPFTTSLSGHPVSPGDRSIPTVASPAENSGLAPFLQTKLTDQIQHEQKFAQARLNKWATGLQQSLQNERQRHERVVYEPQSTKLDQKLSDVSQNDPLQGVPEKIRAETSDDRQPSAIGHKYDMNYGEDPLGLLRWNNIIPQKAWLAMRVAGSFGVLGAVAVWIARNWVFANGDGE